MERIAEQKAKMEQMENELKQLLHRQKEEERKARTRRICQRGGLLEKLLPDTIPLTEGQMLAFFEKTLLTHFARRALADVTAQSGETPAENDENAMAQDGESLADKPAEPPRGDGVTASANAANPANAGNRAAGAKPSVPARNGGDAPSARPPETQKAAV
jgi:hypothetical protein